MKMSRRSKRPKSNWHRDLGVRDSLSWDRAPGRLITVQALLPRPVAIKARREVYPYPLPLQSRKESRVIRRSLRRRRVPLVLTKVRIRIPRVLPLARGSYVSLNRGRLNIHSRRQHELLIQRGELNRVRKAERKTHRRRARHGQLDSPGALAFGSVDGAYRRGWSVDRIADQALVARAILKGGV